MKKILAGGALVALALGGLVATAAPASAHTPQAKADCTSLSVNLTQYQSSNRSTNKVWVTVDGKKLEDGKTFSTSFKQTYNWAQLGIDPASVKSWEVKVDAWDGRNGTEYDRTLTGGPIRNCTPVSKPASPVVPTVDCTVTSVDAIAKPQDTEAITYSKDATGITAKLKPGYAWGDLAGYTKVDAGTAVYPADKLAALIAAQQCATPTPTPTATPTPEATPTPTATPTPESTPTATPTPDATPTATPSATPTASASPSPSASATTPPVLASTGAKVGGAVAFALLLVAGGFGLVWARRRIAQN